MVPGSLVPVVELTVQDIAAEAVPAIAKLDAVASAVVAEVVEEENVEAVAAEEEEAVVASRVDQRDLLRQHLRLQAEILEFSSALFQKSAFTTAIYPSELG